MTGSMSLPIGAALYGKFDAQRKLIRQQRLVMNGGWHAHGSKHPQYSILDGSRTMLQGSQSQTLWTVPSLVSRGRCLLLVSASAAHLRAQPLAPPPVGARD